MSILDRYIARRFLANFAILTVLLFTFAVSVDLLLQLDEYVDAARARVGRDAGFVRLFVELVGIVADFHGPRIFQFYAYMVGLISVGAMGFTLAQMHRHRELVAVLASGVRLQRAARPLVLAALGLSVLQLLNQEFVLPRLAPLLIRDHDDIGRATVGSFEVPFTTDGRSNLLRAPIFEPRTATLRLPTILERDAAGRTTRRISADSARWDSPAGAWLLSEGWVTVAQPEAASQTTATFVGEPIDRWHTDLTPQVLTMRRFNEYATRLSLAQIRRMLGSPGVVNADALVRYACARVATLLINMLVLLMALPWFLLRGPANLLRNSALCAAMAIPAMIGSLLSFAVAFPGIPPALGVFLPVLFLLPVAIYMQSLIKT
jgi:lipopolysaccharide export LptBFGC system permease protein LptF